MKKINFVIGKRQIMISTLLLILAVAAYLNWQFTSSEQAVSIMNFVNAKKTASKSYADYDDETDGESNYGEAELVSNKTQTSNDYFNQAKLQKTASHAEASDELHRIMTDSESSTDKKNEATNQALKLAEIEQQENSIENQVRTKGFADCVVYVDNGKVNAMVKTEKMTADQAAQIKDIIVGVTNVKPYNIVVTPVA